MIPPRHFPPGNLYLIEVMPDKSQRIVQQLPTSSRNRDRLNQARQDLLMVHPTRDLYVSDYAKQEIRESSPTG